MYRPRKSTQCIFNAFITFYSLTFSWEGGTYRFLGTDVSYRKNKIRNPCSAPKKPDTNTNFQKISGGVQAGKYRKVLYLNLFINSFSKTTRCGHVIHLECIDHITLSSDEQRNNNFLFSKFVDVIAEENDEERSQRQRRQRICPCHSDIRRTLLFKHSHSHSGNYQLTNNHHLSDQNEFIRNGSIINIFEHLFQRPTN